MCRIAGGDAGDLVRNNLQQVINTDKRWTLPLGTMQYQGQFGTDWGRVLAFVSIAMVPAIVFYLFAERQIIAGLTSGSVKG